jgi:hypothetical protein
LYERRKQICEAETNKKKLPEITEFRIKYSSAATPAFERRATKERIAYGCQRISVATAWGGLILRVTLEPVKAPCFGACQNDMLM